MPARRGARTHDPALTASQVVLLVAIALAVAGKGAFYRTGQLLSGGVLTLAVVLAVVPAVVPGRRARMATAAPPKAVTAVVASLLGLGSWAVARGALAGDARAGLPVLALTAAAGAAFAVGHVATPAQRRSLRRGVVVVAVLSAVSGWAGFVWRLDSLALANSTLWRAAGTLTYENALACLVTIAALVVTAELLQRVTPVAAGALCLLLLAGAATQSRAGAVALLSGATTLVWSAGWRPVLRVVWRPAAGAATAAACLLPSAAVSAPPRPGLALAGLCAGLAVATWPADRLPRTRVPARLLTATAVMVAAVVLAGAGIATRPDAGYLTTLQGRLSLSSEHRVAEHRAAVALLAAQPLAGTGPGRATLRWRDEDGRALRARFVHNEYLQVAVELGLIGGALLAVVLLAVAVAVRRGRTHNATPWAGVAGALVATAVHGAFDFVWHLPAIPVIAALLAGTATTAYRATACGAPDPRASSTRSRTDDATVGSAGRPGDPASKV